MKVVVTLTSWAKRITNVPVVLRSILNSDRKADAIYLNLSEEEFVGKELDLPSGLVELCNDNGIIINWCGKNTKTFKKVFPILQYLDDEDCIINMDDDVLFPKNLIDIRLQEIEKYDCPISSSYKPKHNIGSMWCFNIMSIFKKKHLANWEHFVNDEIIATYNDDWCYAFLSYLNGYKVVPSIALNRSVMRSFNENESSGRNGVYVDHYTAYNTLLKRANELFGRGEQIGRYFNIYNKDKAKHDCLLIYHDFGLNSRQMENGKHYEIEYVVASLQRYCSTWLGRIFVVGSQPPKAIEGDVEWLPCDNPYTHFKDANLIYKVKYAIENINDLTDDFMFVSDDQIVTKESDWEDFSPRIGVDYNDTTKYNDRWWSLVIERGEQIGNIYQKAKYLTLKKFEGRRYVFEPHIWSPMNKAKFMAMCDAYDWENDIGIVIFTLYYNFIKEPIRMSFDHKTYHKVDRDLSIYKLPRHIGWFDKAFNEKRFRNMLNMVVGFKLEDEPNYKDHEKVSSIRKRRLRGLE